jgi:hypothetical protein
MISNPTFADNLNKPSLIFEMLQVCIVFDIKTFPGGSIKECPKYCSEIFKLLSKTKILGKDQREAKLGLKRIYDNPNEHWMMPGLAVKLTPHISRSFEQNMWKNCSKLIIMYFTELLNKFGNVVCICNLHK